MGPLIIPSRLTWPGFAIFAACLGQPVYDHFRGRCRRCERNPTFCPVHGPGDEPELENAQSAVLKVSDED